MSENKRTRIFLFEHFSFDRRRARLRCEINVNRADARRDAEQKYA